MRISSGEWSADASGIALPCARLAFLRIIPITGFLFLFVLMT